MSHNTVLCKMLDELQVHSERLFYYTKYRTHGVETFIKGFREIIEALKEKDEEKAARYAIEHLESYLEVIKAYLF
ncbi:hypothetical protein SDC9_189681 [bioreactor metagenome]|uniref:GntR C-terminal domain-containing protein n=1 Tax=bioreactor metagenome TaxID=1076179 RepID=A0A645HSU6_9ZZZZ